MREIANTFIEYSSKLPESITQETFTLILRKDLKSIENMFDLDINDIRILIDEYMFGISPIWLMFHNPRYLLETSLYKRGQPPTGYELTITWIANLYMAKEVLCMLINYIIKIIARIKIALTEFLSGHARTLYELMNEYIGCCDNIVTVADEYGKYFNQIQSSISGQQGPISLSYPMRENISTGINECLLKTRCGNKVIFPSVRTYTEFPILQDVSIIMMHFLNRKRKTKKIKAIDFKRRYSTGDMFSVLASICSVSSDQMTILRKIYDWGSGSTHLGQLVPLSIIWYSIKWLQENMNSVSSPKPNLRYTDVRKIFNQLMSSHKIAEYVGNIHYVHSIYDRIVLL